MKLILKEFQDDAVSELRKRVKVAKIAVQANMRQAIILASPTGSGKTVITTKLMEDIVTGTDDMPAEPDAVFLWLSDQPELNEQSRKKIVATSDRFRESDLVIIDSDFVQETFDGGKVYFLNIQKLGKDKNLVTTGDKRQYTIWDTITNTTAKKKDKFYLIIDEAHRGTKITTASENDKKTVMQKFVLGHEGEIPPIDLIIGVSATPQRFQQLLANTQEQSNRSSQPYEIKPDDVRSSGLLKDKIILFHPDVDQPSDWTLLAEAARRWMTMRDSWNSYTTSQGQAAIHPAMVIQVEDGNESKKILTRTNLELAIQTLEHEIGPIKDEELAHSFQEDGEISVGGRKIRKIEASRIQEETCIKFVFFKMALTTGWDCPRAEVMMSFRRAQDHTLIAQLIGRMIRTPLARRIEGQELLNSVSLYLPHYNAAGLEQVITHLKSDPESVPPTDVEQGKNIMTLVRRADCDEIFSALSELPTYRVDKIRKASNVRRMMKLSRLLTAFHGIDKDALDDAKKLVVDTLDGELARLRSEDPQFDDKVSGSDTITIKSVTVEQGIWKSSEGDQIKVPLTDSNIDDLFNRAKQRLGDEGLEIEYWKAHFNPDDPLRPKLELFLILQNETAWNNLEKACEMRIHSLFEKHKAAIKKQPSSEREKYDKIKEIARDPEAIDFAPPLEILATVLRTAADYAEYEKHLYNEVSGVFGANLNTWERATIEAEISKENVVGWLRNYERKPWALCLSYDDAGISRPMYPDFLVVRKDGEDYTVDILEPHRDDLDDSWKKAKGLAIYATKHWVKFGRIELIRKVGGSLKRLDMNSEAVRSKVLGVTSNAHLNQLFDAVN